MTSASAPETASKPEAGCLRLTDFATTAETEAWFTVNDGVMGGQSSGGPTFTDSVMNFAGTINTDGGGFSSIRASLADGVMADTTSIMLRVRTDGRQYKLTLRDAVERSVRLVSYQGDVPQTTPGEWETVTIQFEDLRASSVGREIETEAFDRAQATEIGFIISDGVDGDFLAEFDWIDLCN